MDDTPSPWDPGGLISSCLFLFLCFNITCCFSWLEVEISGGNRKDWYDVIWYEKISNGKWGLLSHCFIYCDHMYLELEQSIRILYMGINYMIAIRSWFLRPRRWLLMRVLHTILSLFVLSSFLSASPSLFVPFFLYLLITSFFPIFCFQVFFQVLRVTIVTRKDKSTFKAHPHGEQNCLLLCHYLYHY